MPPNSQQRAIFVYLRSKNDHKSCTPAGAKLTDEYTHRNNKNNPSTISVTPSQLCTFFRKRTFSTWASFISSEVSFDSSEEFFLPHVEITFPRHSSVLIGRKQHSHSPLCNSLIIVTKWLHELKPFACLSVPCFLTHRWMISRGMSRITCANSVIFAIEKGGL